MIFELILLLPLFPLQLESYAWRLFNAIELFLPDTDIEPTSYALFIVIIPYGVVRVVAAVYYYCLVVSIWVLFR